MARYRFVIFCEPKEAGSGVQRISKDNLSTIDGYICGSEIFSLDTLRWMLPEMSEEKLHETFKKILNKKIEEAEENGIDAVCEDVFL